jgi:hypothetical protein
VTDDAYEKAHAEALAAPLLPEMVPSLPDDQVAVVELLRALNGRWRISAEDRAKIRWSVMDMQTGGDGSAAFE